MLLLVGLRSKIVRNGVEFDKNQLDFSALTDETSVLEAPDVIRLMEMAV
jgi:hypothetical protein